MTHLIRTAPIRAPRVWVGAQGDGKTLLMVRHTIRLLDARPGLRGYGNLLIDHPKYEVCTPDELMAEDGPPGIRVYDEAGALFESRRSMSTPLSWLNETRQQRKGARYSFMTVQEFSMIDARWRSQVQRVHRAKARFRRPERRDPETDDLVAGGHPLYVLEQVWKGGDVGVKQKKEDRIELHRIAWAQLRPYLDRYDTMQKIALAEHLAAQKDFYADKRKTS